MSDDALASVMVEVNKSLRELVEELRRLNETLRTDDE